jgi:O-antigen/teichoic acid export membrane protein
VIAAYLLHAIFSLSHLAVMHAKTTRLILYASTVAATANIVLNFWWIPLWGLYGAAYATFAAYGVEAVLMQVFAQRLYRLDYDFGRITVALGILAATLALTQLRADMASLSAGLAVVIISFALLAGRDLQTLFRAVRVRLDGLP